MACADFWPCVSSESDDLVSGQMMGARVVVVQVLQMVQMLLVKCPCSVQNQGVSVVLCRRDL